MRRVRVTHSYSVILTLLKILPPLIVSKLCVILTLLKILPPLFPVFHLSQFCVSGCLPSLSFFGLTSLHILFGLWEFFSLSFIYASSLELWVGNTSLGYLCKEQM